MTIFRTRGWRRARAAQQQRKQAGIYRAVTRQALPAHSFWDKQHALSCGRANCGFCRNPRFNRNSNGTARLTLAERQIALTEQEWQRDERCANEI